MQIGKCSNFGNCDKADSRETLQIPDGADLVCPICHHQLTPIYSGAGGGSRSSGGKIVGLVLLLVLLAGVGFLAKSLLGSRHGGQPQQTPANAPQQTQSDQANNAGGAVPAAARPGDILIYYERSAQKWLEQARDAYNQQNPNGAHIVTDFRGSREGKQDILYGKGQPVIWNPADVYWPEKLNRDWKDPQVGKHSDDIIGESHPILSTRLVLVMRADRATAFKAAMQKSEYRGKTWALLYDLATRGWAVASQPIWGKLKLVQTNPIKSNSGMTALSLMFAEYRRAHPDATPASADFLKMMRGIEDCVGTFEETTSKALDSFVSGGSAQADMAIGYEQNVYAAVDKGASDLRVAYPDPTVAVDFPAAILKASWVTPDQARDAKRFLDMVLTRDTQQHAIDYGFRPVLSDMRSVVDNAFSSGAHAAVGFELDPPVVDRPVSSHDVDDLLYQWDRAYKGR